MPGLLDPVKGLFGSLSSLALVGALFKPIPPLISSVQDAVNGLGLLPAGLELNVMPATIDPSLCAVNYTMPAPVNITFEVFNQSTADVYRYRQQSAVNLGGWFVNEEWMTPSFFACAAANKSSEIDLANGFGSVDNARQALEQHWDTFIDIENDFAYLAGIGINTLRLPVGYWSLGPAFLNGTPFEAVANVYNSSWPRIMNVISNAEKHGLGVLVDLHGAPGSQNGLPHSGVSDGVQGLFGNATNEALTQSALVFMTQQLASINNVVGIELLNEPSSVPELEDFYSSTMAMMRNATTEAATLPLYIHDAFDLTRFAPFVANRTDMVILDHHAYYVAGGHDAQDATSSASTIVAPAVSKRQVATSDLPADQQSLNTTSSDLLQAANTTHRNMVIGEWSCALANSTLANQTDPLLAQKKFCTAQQAMYANVTSGWAFWSYAVQECTSSWCFRSAVGTTLPSKFSSWLSTVDTQAQFDSLAVQNGIAALIQKPDEQILDSTPAKKLVSASISGFSSAMSASVSGSSIASASGSGSLSAMPSISASGMVKVEASASTSASDSVSASLAAPTDAVSASGADAAAEVTSFADWYQGYVATATMYSLSDDSAMPSSAFDSDVPTATDDGSWDAAPTSTSDGFEDAEATPTPMPGSPADDSQPAYVNNQRRWNNGRLRAGRYRPRIHPRDFLMRRVNYTPQEQAIVKAYSDGFAIAKLFAQQNGSRLGFKHQMIQDKIAALVGTPELSDGMDSVYAEWFKQGLGDAEAQIEQLVSSSSASARRMRLARA